MSSLEQKGPPTPPSEEDDYAEKGRPKPDGSRSRPSIVSRVLQLPRRALVNTFGGLRSISKFRRGGAPQETKSLRRTAYLDGLRGFAALLVYVGHHELWAHEGQDEGENILENVFGYKERYYFVTLPFVRTFFAGGHISVATFFVISGYVLSAKPMALIHASEYVQLGDNLASALFRRWLRLWLPIFCTSLLTLSMWHVFGILADFEPQSTFGEEVGSWYRETKAFTFLWDTGNHVFYKYNLHLWSIPVEMKGSITIYTCALALSRCSRNARLLCELVLIWYFLYVVDGAFFSIFLSGMLLGDLDLLAMSDNIPGWIAKLERLKTTLACLGFGVAIFLAGAPSATGDMEELRASPGGWSSMSHLVPQAAFQYKLFYNFWASTLIVACVPRISPLKRFFETRFCQYLGRISFAFYLVHGPVLFTLGDRLYAAVGRFRFSQELLIPNWIGRFPITNWGIYGLELNFLLPQLILLPATMWLAGLVTACFDDPSIRFASWLYKKVTAAPQPATETAVKP